MEKQNILQFLNSDKLFSPTKILTQHWNKKQYSYLHTPRPDHGLLLLLEGTVEFHTQSTILTAKQGNLIFLPKGSYYKAVFPNETVDYLVSFDGNGADCSLSAPTLLFENTPTPCTQAFQKLAEGHDMESGITLSGKGLFYLFLDSLVRHGKEERDPSRRLLDRACGILHQNTDLPIGEVAKACAVSESGLRQLFHKQLGLSPAQYRTQIKIKRAMYLLQATSLSIREISDQLNFFDTAYFYKVFKAHTGMTPAQYAKTKSL